MLWLITICIFKLKVLLVYRVIKLCKYKGVQSLRKETLHDQSSLCYIKIKDKNILRYAQSFPVEKKPPKQNKWTFMRKTEHKGQGGLVAQLGSMG